MKKVKVCAYARVSTDSKDQENSYENQKNYFEREISKNPNYELVEVYKDKGLTATSTARRKDFLRMIRDAGIDIDMYAYTHQDKKQHQQIFTPSDREPKFEKIFVKNTSRFARNIDIIDLLRKLREKGVAVDFLDIDKTTTNESDFVFIELLLVFDENDSRDKSRKVKFGQLEGMKNGVVHVNNRLYGYKKIDKYTLEIIPEEAEVIRFIFEEYAGGKGVRLLINALREKGYKTRQGKDFGKSTLLNILKNEKYKGDNVRRKYTTGTIFVDKTSTSRLRNEDDWIVHENSIPSIVSEELWDRCNELLVDRRTTERGRFKGYSKYAGILKCGVCGDTYHRNVDRGRFFYNCRTKKQSGVNACNSLNVNESFIDESLEILADGGFYADISHDKQMYVNQLLRVKEIINKKLDEGVDINKVAVMNKELEELKSQKNRLSDLFLSGRVSIEYFDEKSLSIDQRIKELNARVEFLYSDKETIIKELKDIDLMIEKLINLDIKEVYTEDEILEEIESIEVERDLENSEEVAITFNYKILSKMNNLVDKYGEDFYGKHKSYYEE